MRNVNGLVGLILIAIIGMVLYAVGIIAIIALLGFGIYRVIRYYYRKNEIKKNCSIRLFADFLEEISDVDINEVEHSDLILAIKNIISEFGVEIIYEKKFLNILSDNYSFRSGTYNKNILKYFIDENFILKLSEISTNKECLELIKSFYNLGIKQYPNDRYSVIKILIVLACITNDKLISETLKTFYNGNDVIPANKNHTKIIIRRDTFEHSYISIHDIDISQKTNEISIKFEITGNDNAPYTEANNQDYNSAYHVCCLLYNQENIVIGKSVLASNYSHRNLLQIINSNLNGIETSVISKIRLYVERGCNYYEFDQMNSIFYDYKNQIPFTSHIKTNKGSFLTLSHLLQLQTSYNSHIINAQATYHNNNLNNSRELLFFMELEYYGDKSFSGLQLLIYDKNNILKQKTIFYNSYITVDMYHYYTTLHIEECRLDYDDIGKICLCNSDL